LDGVRDVVLLNSHFEKGREVGEVLPCCKVKVCTRQID
jgi:hypothetical protein